MNATARTLARCVRLSTVLAIIGSATVLAGCASPLPPYQSSFANQESLSRLPRNARFRVDPVGEPSAVESQVRAYRFTAPNGATWGSFLRDGIRSELSTSGNFDANAAETIKVTLLRVQIADGHAHVSARFVVQQGEQTRYDKTLHADGHWRTSVLGAIAVPAASSGASTAFQQLLSRFFNDPDFVKAGS